MKHGGAGEVDDSRSAFGRAGRRIVLAVVVAGVLGAFSLKGGFFCWDDWAIRAILDGERPSSHGTPFDLWRFSDGVQAHWDALVYSGAKNWWRENYKWMLFRPLSSASLVVDHALFGSSGAGYHASSIAWFMAVTGAVGVLANRLLPKAIAWLVVLLFACDSVHFEPVAVICCRHYLVSGLFGVAALTLYVEGREQSSTSKKVMSFVGLLAAFTASEATVQLIPFFLAYELVGHRGSAWKRGAHGAAVIAFVLAYYSVHRFVLRYGSDAYYANPLDDPRAWVSRAALILAGSIIKLFTTH